MVGDKITGHGMFVETLANGDKIHVTYTFEGTSKRVRPSPWAATNGPSSVAPA